MVHGTLDHVGVVVRDFDATAARYARLGLTVASRLVFEDRGVIRGYLSDGRSIVELHQPLRADTPLARFLGDQEEVQHHLCFAVDDLEGGIAALEADGYALEPGSPWNGSRGRNAYLAPPPAGGLVLELVEKYS
ncbi:MAG TPA: VOC family protein [Chloroflexota bacterium]|jgi:methylmalonyl-CoA/ethylmalonyl-CoA epimerase